MPLPISHADGLVRDIGKELRRLRLEKGMTLHEVATAAGFTKMHISKIEHGQISFPLTTLHRIAHALGTSMVQVIESADSHDQDNTLQSPSQYSFVSLGQPGVTVATLCHQPHSRIMLPLLVELNPGAETGGLGHPTDKRGRCEEWAYVLQGRISLTVSEERYEGGRGCTFCFSGNLLHTYRNIGTTPAKFLTVRVPQL